MHFKSRRGEIICAQGNRCTCEIALDQVLGSSLAPTGLSESQGQFVVHSSPHLIRCGSLGEKPADLLRHRFRSDHRKQSTSVLLAPSQGCFFVDCSHIGEILLMLVTNTANSVPLFLEACFASLSFPHPTLNNVVIPL